MITESWIRELFWQSWHAVHGSAAEANFSIRRVSDGILTPGRWSVRIEWEERILEAIEICFHAYSAEEWRDIYGNVGRNCRLLSRLIVGAISKESILELGLLEHCLKKVSCFRDGKLVPMSAIPLEQVCEKLVLQLEREPALIFLLCGKAREEIIVESMLERWKLRNIQIHDSPALDKSAVDPMGLPQEIEDFYGTELREDELSMSFRADELPAILFKRKAQLPLDGVEELTEHHVETIYETVSRRAQAYAFGLT